MELFGFGPHLVVDGHHASPEKLDDEVLLARALSELPSVLSMTVVVPPRVERVYGSSTDDAGLTGVVLVAESHVAIHTFPSRGFMSVDVFSCREFDVQRAVSYLVEHFDLGRFETHFNNRGKEFPKDPELVGRIVRGEREYLEARIA